MQIWPSDKRFPFLFRDLESGVEDTQFGEKLADD